MNVGDYTLEDTVTIPFTTRAFATGIPTVLTSGEVQIYEDTSVTQITAAETLTVSLDSVVGLNIVSIAATSANGFEAGKSYTAVLSAGTVGGVSAVGEVVGHFTLARSAAATDLANGTDGLSALKTDIADVPTVAEFNARTLVAASYFDPAADTVANVTTVATLTGHTAQTADHTAGIADIPTVAEFNARTLPTASYFDASTDTVFLGDGTHGGTNATLTLQYILVQNPNGDGVTFQSTGFGGSGLHLKSDLVTGPGAPGVPLQFDTADADLATLTALATAQADLDIITGASGVNLLTATQASIDAIEAKTNLIPASFNTQWGSVYAVGITGITATEEAAAGKHSVAATVMMSTNAALSGGTLTAKKPSDDSTFNTYTVTTDAAADNITGVS